jgi:hypothetical protein
LGIAALFLLAPHKTNAAGQWQIGVYGATFPAAGNLQMKNPGWEWGLGVGRLGGNGGGWQVAFSRITPKLKDGSALSDARMTYLWCRLEAVTHLLGQQIRLMAGPGVGYQIKSANNRKVIVGSPAFTADGLWFIGHIAGINVEAGIGIRTSMIPGANYDVNRLNLAVSFNKSIGSQSVNTP